MEAFFSFLKLLVLIGGINTALFIIFLSLPESKLRGITLHVFGGILYAVTGIWVLYIISPLDLIPDIIPVLGQIDDAGALVLAIFTGISGIICTIQGRQSLESLEAERLKRLNN